MENYYAAYAGGDTDSLEMIAQPLSDNEKSYITTFSEYYEDYQNITCYSTKGATDDSYLVSVCYDLKFKGWILRHREWISSMWRETEREI